MPLPHTVLALVLPLALLSCSPGGPRSTPDPSDGRATGPAAGAPAHPAGARPVALEADDFDDLEFLRPLLEGKRIVQLGENTHGTREYALLKARIVRFLHGELGWDVLAFESALYQCWDADRRAAASPARSTLLRCAFGVWHTEEVLPLFEYLRGTRETDRPLWLAGIDVQPIGSNKEHRPAFLAGVVARTDPGYAAEVRALDSTFLDVYARGGSERRAWFRSAEGRRMAAEYDRLADFLAGRGTGGDGSTDRAGAEAGLVAERTARSMARYVRQQAAPTTREYVELRDEGMAENLAFLVEDLHPGRRVVVWGHNFHVRHDNLSIPPDPASFPDVAARTMGSWIRERYGDEVYTVGFYAYEGRAANNAGEVFDIPAAPPGSLEHRLRGGGSHTLFLELSDAGAAWTGRPVSARFDGTVAQLLVPRDQYDAVVVVPRVTPRVMLY